MSNPVVLLYFGSKRVDFLNIAYFQLVSYPYRPPNYQNLRNLKKPQPKQSISCPYLSGHLKLERITSLTPISTQPTKKSPPLHPDRRRRRRRSIPRWPRSRRSASTSSPPAARRQAPPSPGTPQLPPTQLTPAAASVGFDSIGSRDSAAAVCSVFFFSLQVGGAQGRRLPPGGARVDLQREHRGAAAAAPRGLQGLVARPVGHLQRRPHLRRRLLSLLRAVSSLPLAPLIEFRNAII